MCGCVERIEEKRREGEKSQSRTKLRESVVKEKGVPYWIT